MAKVILRVISESENKYELQTSDGVISWVHKSLITDNHIPIIESQVEVSDLLFQNFFASHKAKIEYEKKIVESEKTYSYLERIPFLIDNLELIQKNSEYYHLYFNLFKIGHYIVFRVGLGGLLESYKSESILTSICKISNQKYYIYSGTGSPFSGSGCTTAYCVGCKDLHFLRDQIFSDCMAEFKRIQAICPPKENEEAKKQLRVELGF
jgi:hypothetical protein